MYSTSQGTFNRPKKQVVYELPKRKLGILTICEDVWNDPNFLADALVRTGPRGGIKQAGNHRPTEYSASPLHHRQEETCAYEMLRAIAMKHAVPGSLRQSNWAATTI